MSYPARPSSVYAGHNTSSLSSSFHHQHTSSTSQTALQTRINQKRAELENLQQLKLLSAQLASQMSTLEQKLGTLRDGTEAVAHVLANWEGVLGVIGLAGNAAVKVAERQIKKDGENEDDLGQNSQAELPETLIRIPVGDAAGEGAG